MTILVVSIASLDLYDLHGVLDVYCYGSLAPGAGPLQGRHRDRPQGQVLRPQGKSMLAKRAHYGYVLAWQMITVMVGNNVP